MYPVSAEYISAMNKAIQRHRISGLITNRAFNGADILQGSMTLTDQCSDSTDLTLGGVFVGTLKFTLLNDFGFSRGSWKGRQITLNFSQLVDEANDRWETIPVGVYFVSEANHTEHGIEITAYTSMSLLDKPYPNTSTSGTLFDVLSLVCKECGLVLANTEAEIRAMPNGEAILGIYPENGCSTWRDIAHYAAQIVGGFLTSDRLGRIVLRRFGTPSGFTVDTTKRLTGSKFSDFKTNYTSVSVENLSDRTLRTAKLPVDDGLLISLGQNPLLQYGTPETLEDMLNNILNEVHSVAYIPFKSPMVGNPAFDLGDLITYTGGTAGATSTCCLMTYTWKFNNTYSVQGFGKNPSIANAQSKADKAISGINSQSKSDITVFVTYENSDRLNVGSAFSKIVDLHATNMRETMIEFWVELKMNVSVSSLAAVLEFKYALDGVEEVYKPIMTFNHSGIYTDSLHFYWKLDTVMVHSFEVFLKVNGGSVNIDIGDIHALLKGQGMAQEEKWDGRILIEETFGLALKGNTELSFNDNGAQVNFLTPDGLEFYDIFGLNLKGNTELPFSEVLIHPTIVTGVYNIVTEDGRIIVTEDGRPLINEGGES